MSGATPRAGAPTPSPCGAAWPAATSTRRPRRCSSPRASSTTTAEEAEAAFKDEVERFIYSRYGNPTVRDVRGADAAARGRRGLLRHRLGHGGRLRGAGRAAAARATAWSARAALFGSCFVILDEILPRWGVETVFVDGPDLDQWREALSEPTAAVFFETPSNPMQELVDIAGGRRAGPRGRREGRRRQRLRHAGVLQAARARRRHRRLLGHQAHRRPGPHPRRRGARHRASSSTGRCRTSCATPARRCRRSTRGCCVKGLETLSLRVEQQADERARGWRGRSRRTPKVTRGRLPVAASRTRSTSWPRRQMCGGGTVVTFELDGGKDEAFALMNALQVVDISNNLGDAKSLDHPPGDDDPPPADARRRGRRSASPTACCGSRSAWRTSATWSRTSSAPWLTGLHRGPSSTVAGSGSRPRPAA